VEELQLTAVISVVVGGTGAAFSDRFVLERTRRAAALGLGAVRRSAGGAPRKLRAARPAEAPLGWRALAGA
jgi:hypothetical protein